MCGIELTLPQPTPGPVIKFKAIVVLNTSHSLILEPFYRAHVQNKVFSGVQYEKSLLRKGCIFSDPFGNRYEDPPVNGENPQYGVSGIAYVPFLHQGRSFEPKFVVVEHMFYLNRYESNFVAVLGSDFLEEYKLPIIFQGVDLILQWPPQFIWDDLVIYTDGCCLSNVNRYKSSQRAGYGVHFPTLPEGFDISGPLPAYENHTNRRAQLFAVINALKTVRERGISCRRIVILTDSMYAVLGLNVWIPVWRHNGYRAAGNNRVANSSLFVALDNEARLFKRQNIAIAMRHVFREENRVADRLAKEGARRF